MARTSSSRLTRKIRRSVPTFEPLEGRRLLTAAAISFTEFPQIALGTNFLQNLAAGPDGNVYFSSGLANNVNAITPSGAVTVYDVTAVSPHGPGGVAAGADGNVYFNVGNNFGVVSLPAGTVSEIPLNQALNSAQRMILGPDGNFWVDDFFGTIERVTPAGQVTDFPFTGSGSGSMASFNGGLSFTSANSIRSISTAGTFGSSFTTINGGNVEALAVGPDGNLWYTEQLSVNSVVTNFYGYITPAGVQKEFASTIGPVSGIAAGQDGNIYFRAADYLVGVNPAGTVVATQNLGMGNNTDGKELIDGPDGNLWFNESFNDKIGVAYIPAPTLPTIATQPSAQSAVAGNSVSFTAAATGIPTPTVQWQISTDGTTFNDISGATAATYTFTPTINQTGDLFRAVFTNSQGSATTNPAGLTVTPAPAAPLVTTQPANQSVAAGTNVSFTAAASGSPTPSVQWQISTDGITFNDISGATTANYVFAAVASQNGDFFRAVFTNSQGAATTNAATLAVSIAPAIIAQPAAQRAAPGQGVSFIASASGNPEPTVQWQVSTNGTTFTDIPGATATSYTLAAALDQNGNLFRAVFTNSQGSATTSAAALAVSFPLSAPAITIHPGDQTVAAGQIATFITAAAGNPSPTVQWQISTDGTTFSDIPGATSTTYSFVPTADQSGNLFRAVFTNSQGSAITAPAALTLEPVSVPPSAAVPSFGKVTLPAVAVAGMPLNAKVPVIITNSSATRLNGKFTINVYASATPSLDGNQTLIASMKSHLALESARSRTIIASVRSLPPGVAPGAYYVVTEVVDPNNQTSTTTTAQPYQLQAAQVTLNLSQGNVLPSTLALNKSGSISVTLTNTGNVIAAGPLVLALGLSSDGVTPIAGPVLTQINEKQMHIAPGKSVKFKLHFQVTAATPAGTYFPYLFVSRAGATQTAIGTTQFTIG